MHAKAAMLPEFSTGGIAAFALNRFIVSQILFIVNILSEKTHLSAMCTKNTAYFYKIFLLENKASRL